MGRQSTPSTLTFRPLSSTHITFNTVPGAGPSPFSFHSGPLPSLHQAEASLHRRPGPGPQRPPAWGSRRQWGETAKAEGAAPQQGSTGSSAQTGAAEEDTTQTLSFSLGGGHSQPLKVALLRVGGWERGPLRVRADRGRREGPVHQGARAQAIIMLWFFSLKDRVLAPIFIF